MNGLGLTETRILPHYQFIRDHVLDGQKMEDIALADSKSGIFSLCRTRISCAPTAAGRCTAEAGTLRTG